ncbi:MAG: DUF58 domain-containing protein [Oscillospiraceae bacterium]|nr:DUF58 domain-containing protein [Oscillospiraceae bacterium]
MKAIISYLIVLFSSVMYMLLFDKNAGGIMTVFITVTPVLSLILTCVTKNKLTFSLSMTDKIVDKKKPVKLRVNISKDTVLPIPIVSFTLNLSGRFKAPEHDVYRFSMSENKKLSIDTEIYPEICGIGDISLSNIFITDYLGIFKFKINRTDDISTKLFIRPKVREIDDSGDLIRNIYSTLCDNDDDETRDTVDGRSAFPGYEYREYIPGDSLKKINWKISTKRQKLYVRKDESSGITLPNVILNNSETVTFKDETEKMLMQEMIIENSLSLLLLCIKNNIECTYSYIYDGVMKKEIVTYAEQIEMIAGDMASVAFSGEEIDIQTSEKSKSTDVDIIYTLGYSQHMARNVEHIKFKGDSSRIIMPRRLANDLQINISDLWIINDDHSISKYM